MHLSIGQAANMIGVSITTLRRWEQSNKLIPSFRTAGGHRRYSVSSLKELMGEFVNKAKRKVIAYARVSSHDQKEDLKRQINRLDQH